MRTLIFFVDVDSERERERRLDDRDPQRQSLAPRLSKRHAPKLNAHLVRIDEPPAPCSASLAVFAGRGEPPAKAGEGRALCSCDMDPGQQDGELYAVWTDVWVEEAQTPL